MGRFSLKGRIALITGGSRGLGREMALTFAGAGADVLISSRKLDACEALAAEVRTRYGRKAMSYACHIGQWDALQELVEFAYREFGRIDVLVNNAGMSPPYGRLVDIGEDLYDKVMDVNLKGPFRLTSIVGTRMAEGAGGSIINISAAAAVHPVPSALPYSAAKAGLNALTAGFAQAFGPRVRVNAIMPGAFLTDISKSWDLDAMNRKARGHGLGRLGRPEEIVGAALYLASEASSFATGTAMTVDGGVPPE